MSNQLDLFQPGIPASEGTQRIQRPGLHVRYWPRWLESPDEVMASVLKDVPWRQDTITLFGNTHPLPRQTCWMGDPGCHYSYSGVHNTIHPWSPLVHQLRSRIEAMLGCTFNSVLLNHYRDGHDKLDWHADDESELDPASPIASLSLGASRTFRLKPRDPVLNPADALSFELGDGDLLVMDPPTQQHWLHQVPRRLKVTRPRVNLTFRVIRPEAIRHV